MINRRPLIGLTPGYDYEKNMAFIKTGYFEGVQEAGGLPVLLTAVPDEDVMLDIVERCDGILVTGGPDVDAKYYNESNYEFNGEISPFRDSLEIYIVRKAVELNKPVFGICRGIQIMNVAFGGSLYQDIHLQVKGRNLIKHSQNAPRWYPTHSILLEKGSKVRECFKEDRLLVNSFHHQSVKDVAPGFRVTARADDGIIECIEHEEQKFAVGVQWHPEMMWKENPAFLKLFEVFVESSAGSS